MNNINKSIRIVVPTHNSEYTIGRCLDAIYASSYRNFEVVVVDDASRDRTVEIVGRYPCRSIKFDINRGAASARNSGTVDCSTTYLLFIDSDVIIRENTIKQLLERACSKKTEAVIGCYSKLPIADSLFSIYHNLFQHFYFFHNTALHSPNSCSSVFWTGCGLVEVRPFREVGGFCESIEGASIEDTVFGHEFTKRGFRIYIDINIDVSHDHGFNFFQLMRNYYERAINVPKAMSISMPDKLINQGYFNILNLGVLIFSYMFILALIGTVFSMRFYWFALFSFLFFLLFNLNLYLFILRQTTITFTIFSTIVNFFCYIMTGIGLLVGTIGVLRSGFTGNMLSRVKK